MVYTYLVAIATSKALRTYGDGVSSSKGDDSGIGGKGKREYRGGSRELLSKGNNSSTGSKEGDSGVGSKNNSGNSKLLNYSSSSDNGYYYYYYYLLGSIVEFSLAYVVVAYYNMV
ncbi:uncharacterized protein IWZ02DRAFT_435707 [Phyllosticta citriasiana]|uniref:uncharacterized protein n=1 Tax=Phyllosticta citriasiana TaxID=595635 RepID=UPI0030FD9045